MGNQLDQRKPGEFKWSQGRSVPQVSPHAATDDRCANFSAPTCPTQQFKFTANSTADKLPLEKFHRLLDLAFWVKFLKFDSISCFVFLWDVYRVSLAPVACGALNLKCAAGGGKGHNQLTPPRPTISDR
jgi:hypothetical protein